MQAKREHWSGFAKEAQASHLVFLDESGVNINMTRRYGWGKDDSLRRMLYLASQRITRRWRTRCQNWDLVLSQLEIMFAGRAAG